MGIDASTNSIAFCIFWNRRPIKWGKVNLNGSTIYDRILDAKQKVAALQDEFDVQYVAIEAAVFVKSAAVAIKLSYVYGAILAELMGQGVEVIDVAPMSWQSHIGNGPLTKAEKEKIKKDSPGKKPSWYQARGRDLRKQKTLDFFNKRWNMSLDDNDVGDSAGIGYYAYHALTKRS